MFLKLNASRNNSFWGWGDYWFSFNDIAPQEVNYDILDKETRKQFKIALKFGQLLEVNRKGKPIKSKVVMPSPRQIAPIVTDKKDVDDIGIDPVIKTRLNQMLQGNIEYVRREVAQMNSVIFVSAAIAIEKEGKARKTAIVLLEKQLEKLMAQTQSRADAFPTITEEEGETVIITRQSIVAEDIPLEDNEDKYVQITQGKPTKDKAMKIIRT